MDVVLASRNAKKLAELQALLDCFGFRLRPVSEFGDEAPEESAPSFAENSLQKARHAARISGLPAIADDSGIEVDALNGAPGVNSARYSGQHGDDAANNARLLAELGDVEEARRGARFVCVLVFLRHADDATPLIAQGHWRGRILTAHGRRPRCSRGCGRVRREERGAPSPALRAGLSWPSATLSRLRGERSEGGGAGWGRGRERSERGREGSDPAVAVRAFSLVREEMPVLRFQFPPVARRNPGRCLH